LFEVGDPPSVLREPFVAIEKSGVITVCDEPRDADGRPVEFVRGPTTAGLGMAHSPLPRTPDALRGAKDFCQELQMGRYAD
jgi:hypothetical protein